MKRPLRPDEVSLWAVVTATVRPSKDRIRAPIQTPTASAVAVQPPQPPGKLARNKPASQAPILAPPPPPKPPKPVPTEAQSIEPGRRRRIVRGRDEIAARLDLHGMDQDRARSALVSFLLRAQEDGARSVLVITGKGYSGTGVLRRRAPEWLSDPALRTVVAGLSPADGRHGGEGAFYVALKRRTR
jgi:DNA-nicking Smr family endonuclease